MLRIAATVGSAALVGGLLSVPLAAEAAPSPISVPSAKTVANQTAAYPAGTYIVTLKDAPAATYTGGVSGFTRTRPAKGKQLNAHSSTVTKYTTYLKSRQASLTKQLGIKPQYSYTTAYSGFSAKLTSVQAARLAKSSLVAGITPDKRETVQESKSLDFLNVSTTGGTWDQVGGVADAGKQIVLGDLDTGIAPENPSFAGSALTSTVSTTVPYKADGDVKFTKADGSVFSSPIDTTANDEWSSSDLNTKIIAAHYYVDGYDAANKAPGGHAVNEYLSPRDGSGHGSHTASTAAGDHDVAASVQGNSFGTISVVAPAAKIAVYKICWTGPDGVADSADDGCFTTDALAAIDQAVTDGVDVLNYSIGGGSASTTFSPTDAAFLNASAAGVFVAAAAGNDGPDASTLDNAAPWETTVAASTIPDYEATAELGDGTKIVGAGISVRSTVSGTFVDSTTYAAVKTTAGVTAARLCEDKSLTAVPADSIVLCDRGVNDRVAKSAEVKRVGGIGMVLSNVIGGADDVDNDFHSVPSVHVSNAYNEALHAYADTAGATVSLVPGNDTPNATPVPQIAGFSSHGPVLAAGSDVLKPDIAAPGVSILAAVANAEGAPAQWDFYSGTSMATPHIAGLALVYLGEHPLATPAEIKSAMMTGATDLVDADGKAVTDPFTQGAGEVHPKTYLDAGLYYPAGIDDWKSYIVGANQFADYSDYIDPLDLTGVAPIDPSDLNQASIAIGDLPGTQTVTRKVTSLASGTYTASVELAGMNATVSPSTLDFTAAGQTKSFTVTFSRTTAALDEWTTGFLTWTSANHTVRSPLAIHPDSVTVPAVVTGTGTTGSTTVTVTPGSTGSLPLSTVGLMKGTLLKEEGRESLPYSGIADQLDGSFAYQYPVSIPADTSEYRVDLDPTLDLTGTDLDLYLFTDDGTLVTSEGVTANAHESFTVKDLPAGDYVVVVDPFATPAGSVPFTLESYTISPSTPLVEGNKFTTDPTVLSETSGVDTKFSVLWAGLAPNSEYVGLVHYGDFAPTTEVRISTGGTTVAPTNTKAPTVSGSVQVGSTVTADPGTWTPSNTQYNFSYQWSADGVAIPGATAISYAIPASILGKVLTVTVTAENKGDGLKASATASAGKVVAANSSVLRNVTKPSITGSVKPGRTVKASAGTWNVPNASLKFGYRWTDDGVPIHNATSSSYKIPASKVGHKLAVVVTAHLGEFAAAAKSSSSTIAWNARTTISLSDPTITTRVKEKVTVTVSAAGSGKETGTVVVHYGSKKKTDVIHASDHGKIVVTLPKLSKGKYKVYAEYKGNSEVSADDSITKTVTVRKAK